MEPKEKTAEEIYRDNYIMEHGWPKVSPMEEWRIRAMKEYAAQETAQLREALKELIEIADYYHDKQYKYSEMPYKDWTNRIENARKLTNHER